MSLATSPSASARQLRIFIVAPVLPPQFDGIGDYTSHLAKELANGAQPCDITILTSHNRQADPIDGVTIRPVFDSAIPTSYRAIIPIVESAAPDWLILQYNPFAYGRRGLNLHLPRIFQHLRNSAPSTRIAVMFHEMYMPLINWKFTIMGTWQRYQFRGLVKAAHVLLFSIDPWADLHRKRFPNKPIYHLPVGSNIERESIGRAEARQRLGIRDEECVLGVFGTAHISRVFHLVRVSAERIQANGKPVRILYIGPHGDQVRQSFGDTPLIADGPLSAEEVSRRLAAIDIYLATYNDGVSTRRGAMMAAMRHGLPVVGTVNYNTDRELCDAAGQALHLIPTANETTFAECVLELSADEQARRKLGQAGLELYQRRFSWQAIAGQLLSILERNSI